MQDLTMMNQIVGVENARLDNDGPKVQVLPMTGQSLQAFARQL